METLWKNAPVIRSLCDNDSGPRKDVDRCTMKINDNWAICVPLGDGSKIRGLRATIIMADEFASIPPDIYETVVQGFASVNADPVVNAKEYAAREMKKELGIWTEEEEIVFQSKTGNQIVISGTADYDFKHYADYWKKYCSLIRAKGDVKKLKEIAGEDENIDLLNPDDFSVIRIPYKLIPKGFMDDKVVMRAKATVHSGIFQMEYGACFTTDSNGFFRRSLIESCVGTKHNPVVLGNEEIWFDAVTRTTGGGRQFVYGIDPASETDNFSIVVLEILPTHTRIVYCWTTNRNDFKKRLAAGLVNEHDFYGFCARKIRNLMKVFPLATCTPGVAPIAMDAQGGGIAVMEALHDPDKFNADAGEVAIWPVIDPDKEADTDDMPGLHIVEMCQFAKYDWTRDANHGLRKDFEDRVLIFPQFDLVTLELATADDKVRADNYKKKYGKELTIYDSLEDCVMEIEELKNELTTIIVTMTGTGVQSRERWDTPEVKLENGRKGRLRKDRYSSLVMANSVARKIQRSLAPIEYDVIGGHTKDIPPPSDSNFYQGPEWLSQAYNDMLGFNQNRGV
jgi:hypothetical protein